MQAIVRQRYYVVSDAAGGKLLDSREKLDLQMICFHGVLCTRYSTRQEEMMMERSVQVVSIYCDGPHQGYLSDFLVLAGR